MARRFSVIQGGLLDAPEASPSRARPEAVAVRIVPQPRTPIRAPIPAQAFVGIRPKDGAPEAA